LIDSNGGIEIAGKLSHLTGLTELLLYDNNIDESAKQKIKQTLPFVQSLRL
jgi:hypothetical protein